MVVCSNRDRGSISHRAPTCEFVCEVLTAGRLSSTPMKGLSYLCSDRTGFSWEVKVRLEILICYLDGDIGFFSCVACPPVLLILSRAASSFFIIVLSSFVWPSVIRLSRRMADGSSPL